MGATVLSPQGVSFPVAGPPCGRFWSLSLLLSDTAQIGESYIPPCLGKSRVLPEYQHIVNNSILLGFQSGHFINSRSTAFRVSKAGAGETVSGLMYTEVPDCVGKGC